MNETFQVRRAGGAAPVVRLDLHQVRMPFSDLASKAMAASENGLGMAIPAEEAWDAGDFLLLRAVDEEGIEGWGEVFVWLPESGVSSPEMVLAIRHHLARYVLGVDPSTTRAIRARMDRNVARNEVAKGLLDQACHELTARRLGCPVHDLLGGRGADAIPAAGLIPLAGPEATAELAMAYQAAGYGTIRIKLGLGPEVDAAVIAATREAVGAAMRIRVDYNQAYRAPTAVRALRLLEPYGIDAAEQPLPIGDVLGMVDVQSQTSIPLFLHEGFFSAADITPLVELGGSRIIGVNLERPGGITAALELIDWAGMRGLGTIIHNQSLGLGTAAQVHLAASRADRIGHAVELAGDVMFAAHLVREPLRTVDGSFPVPTGPGWGVDVDHDAVADFASADPVTIVA